ncbi:MAG: hypothetical protein Q8K75_04655 [Chlamydiales bacterium]|nr:hypothetical protein [Chlamydiales bacterium]
MKTLLALIASLLLISPAMAQQPCMEQISHCEFTYLKMGLGIFPNEGVGPTFGLGKRWESGFSAIDASINWSESGSSEYVSIVKAMYLYRFTPFDVNGMYAGGGMSIGSLTQPNHRRFSGLLAEFAVGFEMLCQQSIRTFLELNISQGMVAFDAKHKAHGFNPFISMSAGFGF